MVTQSSYFWAALVDIEKKGETPEKIYDEIFPSDKPIVHFDEKGLIYALSGFDAFRSFNKKIFRPWDRLERFRNTVNSFGGSVPFDDNYLFQKIGEVLAVNELKDAYIRLHARNADRSIGIRGKPKKIGFTIKTEYFPHYLGPQAKKKGIKLYISKYERPTPDSVPNLIKIAYNYVPSWFACQEATEAGFDEAAMLMRDYVRDYNTMVFSDPPGENIFFIIDDTLIVQPPKYAVLKGVVQRSVTTIADAEGIPWEVRTVAPEDLPKVQGTFLTGNAVEVVPVKQINEKKIKKHGYISVIQDIWEKIRNDKEPRYKHWMVQAYEPPNPEELIPKLDQPNPT